MYLSRIARLVWSLCMTAHVNDAQAAMPPDLLGVSLGQQKRETLFQLQMGQKP